MVEGGGQWVRRSYNLVIFITDQQRAIQDFPAAWVQANLTNLNTLTNTGLTFTNAITNTSRCSPSRGVLTTGLYAPTKTLVEVGGTLPTTWTTLRAALTNTEAVKTLAQT